jgi:hypothetical protein
LPLFRGRITARLEKHVFYANLSVVAMDSLGKSTGFVATLEMPVKR